MQCGYSDSTKLQNDEFCLELTSNSQGIPLIKKGYWVKSNKIAFNNLHNNASLEDWLPKSLIPAELSKEIRHYKTWRIEKQGGVSKAITELNLNQLKIAWIVELPEKGSLFRMHIQFTNIGDQEIIVPWFPIWSSNWNLPSKKTNTLMYWNALTYSSQTDSINNKYSYTLFSKTYSSDRTKSDGFLPYWRLANSSNSLSFGISWCGGWDAHIYKEMEGIGMKITLPPEETQLTVMPGEIIDGPIINVFADHSTNIVDWRANWLSQREKLSGKLFQKPKNWQPLIYNHWYAVRFNLSNEFIRKQLEAMQPYNFDVFVVDAGWYESVGNWTPSKRLFRKGEFENALNQVRRNGIEVGIWSCPWLVTEDNDSLQEDIKFYNKFMNAYTLNLVGTNFQGRLTEHIASLKKQFQLEWWKYDQELFAERPRYGKMKNVIALEDALAAVRQSFPSLNIENCMSGGRMINEFTDQISQSHWIRDGGQTGLKHAHSNIREALGAIQFLSPLKVQRWTNRIDEIDEDDSELLKMYCRSAMIGVWGISTDLHKLTDKQRNVILNEIENYRVLSSLKMSLKYDISEQNDNSYSSVIFYNQNRTKAAVMLFRGDDEENIITNIRFDLLKNEKYSLVNIDTKEKKILQSEELSTATYKITLREGELSALYFLTLQK